ncbi:MAG: hypothetical protein O9312_09705 [Hylemonella sp.]|nr:hypothetical protein [Hylemonella sp.]
MSYLQPAQVLQQLAETLTPEQRDKVIIVGSLAAAYSLGGGRGVYTKDVDTMIAPHAAAIVTGEEVANQLMGGKWTLRRDERWGQPASADVPPDRRPLVRLHPPDNDQWFIELMAAPDQAQAPKLERDFYPIATKHGHFSLVSFGYLGLVQHDAVASEFGVRVATPAMMAMANMLHHPAVGPDLINGEEFGRPIKRSNKDLGRVVSLAILGDTAEVESWAPRWWEALQAMYPDLAPELAGRAGTGFRQMLTSVEDVDQALHTCNVGLLASMGIDHEAFKRYAIVVIEEALKPLEDLAKRGSVS